MTEIVSTYVVAVDRNGDARANIQLPTSPTPHHDSVCHVRPDLLHWPQTPNNNSSPIVTVAPCDTSLHILMEQARRGDTDTPFPPVPKLLTQLPAS